MNVKELNKNEYNSFYQTYIDACGKGELIDELEANLKSSLSLFKSIPVKKQEFSYAEGKWTIKELLQHLIDSERIFTYRALRVTREDKTNIPGYDHNEYVPVSRANSRNYKDLVEEFYLLRKSTIALYKSFDKKMLFSIGTANNDAISVRAIGFILVGHYNHHNKIIKERYL